MSAKVQAGTDRQNGKEQKANQEKAALVRAAAPGDGSQTDAGENPNPKCGQHDGRQHDPQHGQAFAEASRGRILASVDKCPEPELAE